MTNTFAYIVLIIGLKKGCAHNFYFYFLFFILILLAMDDLIEEKNLFIICTV